MICADQLHRSICRLCCGLGWAEGSTSSVVFARWRQCAHMGRDIGTAWRIRLNRPSAAAMQSYVILLWPLVIFVMNISVYVISFSWEVRTWDAMESVAIRQRGGYDFAAHYDHLCALNNTCPVPAVKAHLAQNQLDINADRIRYVWWIFMLCRHCTLNNCLTVYFRDVLGIRLYLDPARYPATFHYLDAIRIQCPVLQSQNKKASIRWQDSALALKTG